MQRMWFWSLVRELRSHMPWGYWDHVLPQLGSDTAQQIINKYFLKKNKKNAKLGCHALFQGIFPTQGSNPCPMSPMGHALLLLSQLCPTLCDPIDGSPPSSPVPGILQARTLEWVAISFSNACKWKVKVKSLSRVRLLATPGSTAYQAPPSMGFSRQEYWSGVPLPSPSCTADSFFTTELLGKPCINAYCPIHSWDFLSILQKKGGS